MTGPPALFASPACAETKTAILTFGCGLAVGLSGLADVFSNLFKSESLTTTIAPKTPVHTVADLGKKGWIFAGSLNSSLSMEDQTTNVDATHKEAKINVGQGGCNHAIIQRQLHCMSSLDGTDCPAFEIIKKAVIDSTGDGCQDPEQMEEKFNAYNCLRETLDTAKGAECFNGSTDVLKKELDENFPSGGFKRFCDHLKKVFICAESVAQLTCKKKDVKKLMTLLKSDYDDMFSPFLGSGCITGNPVKISSVAIQSKYHQQKAANKTAWLSAVFN